MKEPEKSLVHEHARESDQAEAESNFGFGKVGFKHGGLLFRIQLFLWITGFGWQILGQRAQARPRWSP
jgi:hypothetical protein